MSSNGMRTATKTYEQGTKCASLPVFREFVRLELHLRFANVDIKLERELIQRTGRSALAHHVLKTRAMEGVGQTKNEAAHLRNSRKTHHEKICRKKSATP